MVEGEKITLPSGAVLWFYDEDHSYWRHNPETGKRGRRLTGVTTVVKPLDYSPEALMRWAAKTQLKGVAKLYVEAADAEFHQWLVDPDAIWRQLEERNLTYDQLREEKADEGTRVHEEAFERLALGKPGIDFTDLNEREQGLARAVGAFWLDHNPLASEVEQVVYSERLGVAGRLDFRGRIRKRCGNHICACQEIYQEIGLRHPGVIDLKTGGYISAAAHAQVGGGYPLLGRESGFGGSSWAAILQVAGDGTYEFFRAEGTAEQFEAAIAAYRAAGEIDRAAGKERKARRIARETETEIAEAVEAVSAS